MEHPFFMPSQKHLHPIDLKNTNISYLPYLVGVEEFYAACALVKIVAEGDAAVVVLDLAGLGP